MSDKSREPTVRNVSVLKIANIRVKCTLSWLPRDVDAFPRSAGVSRSGQFITAML